MALAFAEPLLNELVAAVEVNEECGHVLGEHLAVAALQRGAGHHGVFAERLTCHHPGVDDVQPRPAVLIGEWNAG